MVNQSDDQNTDNSNTETQREKLTGYDFYRKVLGAPKYVVSCHSLH